MGQQEKNMMSGLQLPYLTPADPDTLGEGSIDPLGLATIADRLADEIAPDVTSRMSRVRFITAIATASVVCEPLADILPADGTSPPYLAFEWLLVTAIARDRTLPSTATLGVPGIAKARAVVSRDGYLDGRSYLKTPKVFGFHGVYKRLAKGIAITDDSLLLAEQGDHLVRTWEREQALAGFADRHPKTPGGNLIRSLESAVRDALTNGHVAEGSGSHLWSRLVRILRPDATGSRECSLLWELLTDADKPIRRELILLSQRLKDGMSEHEALRAIRPMASENLGDRLDAIEAYERVAQLLVSAFQAVQVASTSRGTALVSSAEMAKSVVVRKVSKALPDALRHTTEKLELFGLAQSLQQAFGAFEVDRGPVEFVQSLMERHQHVQRQKDRRPWFDYLSGGFVVRPPYWLTKSPSVEGAYVHPYRVDAIHQFIRDLQQ
jgi:hypothetical protein